MKKQRNELLNIMEAIAAILVIFIHICFPTGAGRAVVAIARISVPFFFGISGYFFYKNSPEKELASIPRKIKHLLLLLLCSEAVYFAYYLLLQIDNCGFTFQAVKNVIESEILDFYCNNLLSRLVVFAPPLNGIFWFVGSLIVVYLCFYFIVRNNQQQTAFRISLVCLVIGYVLRRVFFYTGVETDFPYERLLPFLPFPFFMIGYYIRENQSRFDRISDNIYYGLFVLGVCLTLLEQLVEKGDHTLYAGTLILVPTMLSFGGKHRSYVPKTAAGKYLSHVGTNTATYIYMLHMMVGNSCSIMLLRLLPSFTMHPLYLWLFPVLAGVASCVCADVIYLAKRTINRIGEHLWN